MTRFDEIPDELKGREQWLMWDGSSDSPRRPHWRGNFGVSWTNPDDWHTFEEAVEAASERDSWGIGYVFANTNEEHARGIYGALDLDGCVDGERPKEWLPSLQPFFDADAYMEFSPSGEGIHVPLVGFEPPEWWSDVHFTEEEHEGVEAYGKKFFTFTGDRLQNAGDTVAEAGEFVENWLIEAHKSITGEDPTEKPTDSFSSASEGGRVNRDEFLEESDIRDALGHISPDVDYTTWRDVGFALEDFFTSKHRALSVFTDWSRGGTKWDSDAENLAERIVKDASSGGGRTIGTVIHLAKSNGWEMPSPRGSRGGSGDEYDPEEDLDEIDQSERDVSRFNPAGELEYRDVKHHPSEDRDGGEYGYSWVKTDDSGNVIDSGFKTVCNFSLETVAFLDTYEGDLLNIKVHPDHPREEPYDVQVHPTVFNDARTFREEIVRGRTTYFETHQYRTEQILSELRRTVGGMDAPTHTGTEYIGLHGEEFDELVTPAGVLTGNGWTDAPEYKYYEKGGSEESETGLAERWVLEPEEHTEYNREAVGEMLERVAWMRKPERGLPVLAWFYAAPLKPLIHSLEGQFNLLQVTGGTGTGKTSTLEVFNQLFGNGPSPWGCDGTPFTIEKKLSSSCGLPIWLDEYKPTDIAEWKLKRLHRRLRGVFREESFSKGLPSLGEVTFKMRAPVVFSGEQTVAEAAVRRRTIMTNFSIESTSDRYQRAFCELTGGTYREGGEEKAPEGYALEEHALAYYKWVLSKSADALEEKWRAARNGAREIVQEIGASGLEDSEFQGLQTIVFGYDVYRSFAEEMGADVGTLPGDTDVKDALAHVAGNIGPGGRRREHIDEFTELVAQASIEGYLEEGEHYRVVESRKHETEALAFHMPSTYSSVRKYRSDFDLKSEYSLLSKNDYLDNYEDKIEQGGSYPLEKCCRTKGIENGSKCVHIDIERAEETVGGGFERRAFVDEPDDEPADSESEVEKPTVSPIDDLDPSGDRYVTVTVEVAQWGPTGDEVVSNGGPAESGIVKDVTGPADIVDFFGASHSGPSLEEGEAYRLEDVRVGQYAGNLQLEVVKVTEVTEIQSGVDFAPGDGPGGDSSAGETQQAGLETAATDGGATDPTSTEEAPLEAPPADAEGPRANAQRLRTILEERGRLSKSDLFGRAAERYSIDPETAEKALEKALKTGLIAGKGGGKYASV